MRAGAHKVNPVGINLVNQQKVASDVALTVIGPLPFQAVIQPFRTKGCVIGGPWQHRAFTGCFFFQGQQTVRQQKQNGRDVLPSWRATLLSPRGSQGLAP
jgi:hypothetical protein